MASVRSHGSKSRTDSKRSRYRQLRPTLDEDKHLLEIFVGWKLHALRGLVEELPFFLRHVALQVAGAVAGHEAVVRGAVLRVKPASQNSCQFTCRAYSGFKDFEDYELVFETFSGIKINLG